MRHRLRRIGLAALAASLTTLAGVGTASATVLEVAGTPKNEAVTLTASLKAGSSLLLSGTGGYFYNTCTESHAHGATTTPFIGNSVTGALSSLTFGKCTKEGVQVHNAGKLYVEYTAGTNGGVFSEEAEITVPAAGFTLNCKTGAGSQIGTLTGTPSGHATIDVNAVLNCGFLLPSASLQGEFVVTSPTGLGVAETPTTLEVAGVTKTEPVELAAYLATTSSLIKGEVKDPTSGTTEEFATKCTQSNLLATTVAPYSGAEVGGPVSELTFSGCGTNKVTVDKRGALYVEWTSGTNGIVYSENAEVTVPSPFGVITCTTGEGSKLGTLTGKASGSATMDVAATINCGAFLPSANLKASYVITSPSGLGVKGSPTALEIGGVTQTESISITASLEPGTSALLTMTAGELVSTCTASHIQGATTSPFTGTKVTGFLSELSFSSCTASYPQVDNLGSLSIRWVSGTNGTVTSSGAEITVSSPYGALNCKTGTGTDIGTLTGSKDGYATLDVDAPLDCGPQASKEKWEASYTVRAPQDLGVTNEASKSSTTLTATGTPKNEAITITASLNAGTKLVLARTDGSLANECAESHLHGATESPFTGPIVTGALSTLTFGKCTREGVLAHKAGKLYVAYTEGPNGRVSAEQTEVTVPSPFGTLNCKTGSGTTLGTLTGTSSGHATFDANAVLNCGFLVPSATLKGTYTVTSPTGLGVSA